MADIRITAHIPLDELAEEIHDSLNQSQAIELITLIDANYADLDFTEKLYAAIGDELRREKE